MGPSRDPPYSTIATWAVTNAQGQYSFPRERLEPGTYAIRIRAVGYELPSTSVDVTTHTARLDLRLDKVTSTSKLGMQLSNTDTNNSSFLHPWTQGRGVRRSANLWTAGMDNDFAVRLNVQTGEFTEYLLPHRTNVRHVEVQKSGVLSSLWLGDQHGNTIVRVEPLAP